MLKRKLNIRLSIDISISPCPVKTGTYLSNSNPNKTYRGRWKAISRFHSANHLCENKSKPKKFGWVLFFLHRDRNDGISPIKKKKEKKIRVNKANTVGLLQ